MKAKGHLVLGAGAAGVAAIALQSSGVGLSGAVLAGAIGAASLGALLPDIDHPSSAVSRGLPRELLGRALRIIVPLGAVAALGFAYGGPGAGSAIATAFAPLLRIAAAIAAPAAALVLASFTVRIFTTHRGATHSLVFCAGATAAACAGCWALALSPVLGGFFGLGWLTHLLGDALTHRGVPSLLWPFA